METFSIFSQDLLEEYLTKYNLYMKDLDNTIQDLYQDVSNPSCPTHLRNMLSNSYTLLLNKKKDYQEMNTMIISDPILYFKDMKQFIINFENQQKYS